MAKVDRKEVERLADKISDVIDDACCKPEALFAIAGVVACLIDMRVEAGVADHDTLLMSFMFAIKKSIDKGRAENGKDPEPTPTAH